MWLKFPRSFICRFTLQIALLCIVLSLCSTKCRPCTTRICGYHHTLVFDTMVLCVEVVIATWSLLYKITIESIASVGLNSPSQLYKDLPTHAHIWSFCELLIVWPYNHGISAKPKIVMRTKSLRQTSKHVKQLGNFQ